VIDITYVGPFAEVEFEQGAVWRTCKSGETVSVPDAFAEALLAQKDNWKKAAQPKATKAKTTSEED